MSGSYLQEVEQESFEPIEFVERVARRIAGGSASRTNGENFDPVALHKGFEDAISDLSAIYEATVLKTVRLEKLCKEEETHFRQQVRELQTQNKASINSFQELDERMNFVATKVVHLGDQLESINIPRTRAVEAQKLMNYFAEFLNPGPLISEVFTDQTQLKQSADVIQKLNLIAQELPDEKFKEAKERISEKYKEIQDLLLEEFKNAHRLGNKAMMKEIAGIMSNFVDYRRCIDAFIIKSQEPLKLGSKDIFPEIMPLCSHNYTTIKEVFINPDQVMVTFILNIYHEKLVEYIQKTLKHRRRDLGSYLPSLLDLHRKTRKLSDDLSTFNMGNDPMFLHKVMKNIFQSYLETYINDEREYLRSKCEAILNRYYETLKHQKKQIQSGTLYGLKRAFQASISSSGPVVENYGGEILLSAEVSINLLQETNMAFKRCHELSSPSDFPENAAKILENLFQYLCTEHIDYALEIGLQGIPIGELKEPPKINFFEIVNECKTIMHLFDKQFASVFRVIENTPKYAEVFHKKKALTNLMEQKIDIGLDRSLNAIIAWIKHILQREQKKSDFGSQDDKKKIDSKTDSKAEVKQKSKKIDLTSETKTKSDKSDSKQADDNEFKAETENKRDDIALLALTGSQACETIVKFLNFQVEKIKTNLDGKNVDAVLLELGTRFHRLIFEHLKQFHYDVDGAMLAICDVNVYRKCVREFKIPMLDVLFETLFALFNLLIVQAEKLETVCTMDDQFSRMDKDVVKTFIQLRTDYKEIVAPSTWNFSRFSRI